MERRPVGLGVKGLLVREEEVLVLLKPNGELDLPGGRVEEGETPEECLRREIFEELGLAKVDLLAPMATWSFLKSSGLLINGVTWVCTYRGGRIRLSDEHSGFLWIAESHLRELDLFSRFGLARFGIIRYQDFRPEEDSLVYKGLLKGGGQFC